MAVRNSRRALFEWYDKYVGEAASRREVYGYWTFVVGYVLGVAGVLVYLIGPGGQDVFLRIREIAIVLSAGGLSLCLLGIVLQLPVTRQAVRVAGVGAAVSLLGVAFFVSVYPGNWLGPDSPQRAVIAVYILGVGAMAGVAVLVPVLTGERGFLLDRELEEEGQAIMVGEAEYGGLFAVYRHGPADWRWRLLEQNAVADGVDGFASRPDAESTVEDVRTKVREAGMLEINHAAFRLYGEEGAWQWLLMEEDGSSIATSGMEFADRDAAEESVSVFKEFGPDATLIDIQGAAFEFDRLGTKWNWELLDARHESLAVAPEPVDGRADAENAADAFRAAAGGADVLAIEHLGFEIHRGGDGWRWTLVDSEDETVARGTTRDDSREAVRDRVDVLREEAANAPVSAETEPAFELVAADGEWEWRLVDADAEVVATGHDGPMAETDAREAVDDLRARAAGAGIVEGEDPAFELFRDDGEWGWRLVGEDREVVEVAASTYDAREDVEDAVAHVVEQTEVAELVEYETAAFQLYEAEGGDWRWRLIDEGGGVLTDSGEDYGSRDAAAASMSVIKENAPDAELLQIDSAAIELFRDDNGEWGWRLVDEGGETVAESARGYATKADAKAATATMRELSSDAEIRPIEDGAFQVYERADDEEAGWRWRFLAADGTVLADGPSGHTTQERVSRAVDRVKAAAPDAGTHAVETFAFALASSGDGWGFRLVDRDRETLATSESTYSDRESAADAVEVIQAHAAGAAVFELRDPVYRVRERTDGGWLWELVDADRTVLARAPGTYADRDEAEGAVATVRDLAPDAGELDYDDVAFELFEADDRWRWRLIGDDGERAVSAVEFDTRSAAREALERVRKLVAEASILEIDTSAFELHESEDGWRWRLVSRRGDTVAESVQSYPTRTAAREGMQTLKERGPDAGLVVAG